MKVVKLNEAKFYGRNGNNHFRNHVLDAGGSGKYRVELEKDEDGKKTTYAVMTEVDVPEWSDIGSVLEDRFKGKRVVSYNEVFDRNNPKFPNMTKEEYFKAAEELSLEPYGDPGSNSDVIGFISTDKRGRDERAVKIRKVSKFNPNYSDLVIYIDDEGYTPDNASVSTFMLARNKRVEKELTKVNPDKKPTDFRKGGESSDISV